MSPAHLAPSVPDQETVARLRLVIARLYRQMSQASAGNDLTHSQLSALARLEEHGTMRLGALAAREQVAAPSLTRTITPLTAAGLVDRQPDPTDGRSSLLTLTPSGRELLERLRRQRSELLTDRITNLTADQQEILEAAVPVLELLLRPATATTEPELPR